MRSINKEVLLAFTVFSKELFAIRIGGTFLDVYQFAIAAIGIVLFFRPDRLFQLLASLTGVFGLASVLFLLYDYPITDQFARQAGAITFIYVGTACFLLSCSPEKLAAAYLRVCFGAAVFGLFQFGMSAVGVQILIKLPMRLDSITGEPSHYAVALSPCVYYYVRYRRGLQSQFRAAVILFSLVLTGSATAVAVLSLSVALAFFRKTGFIAILLILVLLPVAARIPPDIFPHAIATRVTSMQQYANTGGEPWETDNLTTLSFATNLQVMIHTIVDGKLLGNGFCGHYIAYRNMYDNTEFVNHTWYGINARAAHCLVIRIISEFGLPGVFLLLAFAFRTLSADRENLWATFCLMAIVARLFKLGSWVDYGMPLFLLCTCYFSGTASSTSAVSATGPARVRLSATPV